jgi:DNA-binding MarR family transcriptional regulator
VGTIHSLAQTIAEGCLAMRTRRINRTLTRIYDEELRPHGASAAQQTVLVALGVAGQLRPFQLAAVLDLEKSTVSRNLRRLEQLGWIAIEDDSSGSQVVRLTDAGASKLRATAPAWERAQARAREVLRADLLEALRDVPI